MEPESGCWSVAIVRMSVDFPAPLGPSRPNMPAGMSSETSCKARTPLAYVFERFAIERFIESAGGGATDRGRAARWRETTARGLRAPYADRSRGAYRPTNSVAI